MTWKKRVKTVEAENKIFGIYRCLDFYLLLVLGNNEQVFHQYSFHKEMREIKALFHTGIVGKYLIIVFIPKESELVYQ